MEILVAAAFWRPDGSVEPDNYARRLYARFGFQQVGAVGGSLTMLLRL